MNVKKLRDPNERPVWLKCTVCRKRTVHDLTRDARGAGATCRRCGLVRTVVLFRQPKGE
jgi:uncharacterized Zn finger protein